MVQTAETIFRDFETDGVPASGTHKPKKSEIRPLLTRLENIYDGALAGGALVYETKADLTADTTQADNAMAWVLGDATVANNGVYQFDGAAWSRLGDLPYSYIKASNAGAGTANAIIATTSIPIPAADGGALIALPISATNDASPVTVSFNDGAALTVKTSSGNDISVGGLTAGMIVAGYVSGATFRLLTDQASAAVVADAEAAADRAEAAADSLNLPTIKAETFLRANADATGYDTLTATELITDLNLKALNGDGGLTFRLTATPTQDIDSQAFGGTWKTPHYLKLETTGAHAGTGRFGFAVEHIAEGSTGASGAVNLDGGAWIEAGKLNWNTDQSIQGPITTLFVNGTNNAWSDLGGVVVNMSKVMTDTPGIFGDVGVDGNGSIVAWESTSRAYDKDGVTLRRDIHCLIGWDMANIPGSVLAAGSNVGFYAEPVVGNSFAAFAAVGRSDLTGTPDFAYVITYSGSRDADDLGFSITGGNNPNGAGLIRAGNGNVNATAYAFQSDPGTGFYREGAGIIGWGNNAGVKRGFFGDGFRVGIPLGGDPGSGSINIAGALQVNGVTRINSAGNIIIPATTSAALADATDPVNTIGKTQGVAKFSTTDQTIYVANAAAATAGWYPSDGGAAIVPA